MEVAVAVAVAVAAAVVRMVYSRKCMTGEFLETGKYLVQISNRAGDPILTFQ